MMIRIRTLLNLFNICIENNNGALNLSIMQVCIIRDRYHLVYLGILHFCKPYLSTSIDAFVVVITFSYVKS